MMSAGRTKAGITRREVILGPFGSSLVWTSDPAAAQPADTGEGDWFRDAVSLITQSVPTGGPHSGEIIHSLYGVEAHRAGRRNPYGVPPELSNFYLETEFTISIDEPIWEVGAVWRNQLSFECFWWTITNEGKWTLRNGVWRMILAEETLVTSGQSQVQMGPNLKIQVLVVGNLFACSVNQGDVVSIQLPRNIGPGHAGIVANCSDGFRRPQGATRYSSLSVWSLDGRQAV
jgi:hypothetical protein